MPVVEGQVFLQAGLVFGLIGLLGLVLRWTFGRDTGASTGPRPLRRGRLRRRDRGQRAASAEHPATDATKPPDGRKTRGKKADGKRRVGDKAPVDATAWGRPVPDASPTSPAPARPTAAHHEDYGLLAVAADVGTADEAATVRRLLKEAGIRNTNAVAPDGRHKVLVFGQELMRARRVAGGGTTGTGGAQGAGGS